MNCILPAHIKKFTGRLCSRRLLGTLAALLVILLSPRVGETQVCMDIFLDVQTRELTKKSLLLT
jgi:hypothetical protein